jgi:methylmalonyl-CoA mutase
MQHFPSHTKDDWLQKVARSVKDLSFDVDGVLYQRLEGPAARRPVHGPWTVIARVDHPDVMQAQRFAEDDLAHGVDGLALTTATQAATWGNLPLHRIALRNDADDAGAEALRNLIARKPLDPSRLAIDFGVTDKKRVQALRGAGFSGPFGRGDGLRFHARGCDDATELGAALAEAVAALRNLDFLDGAELAAAVSLALSASQDMFSTLAKFRAARILWAEILAACKLPALPLALHGETSQAMMADVDAHSNILRLVAAVFGAGLGGASSVCVLPHSIAQGVPNAFARRVARNVQQVLLHEANLWRVDDPAAGAGAIVALTDQMCDQAWSVMQACERGDWPSGGTSKIKPVIGVSMFKPSTELSPDIEVL